jgi:hypothetical protein
LDVSTIYYHHRAHTNNYSNASLNDPGRPR